MFPGLPFLPYFVASQREYLFEPLIRWAKSLPCQVASPARCLAWPHYPRTSWWRRRRSTSCRKATHPPCSTSSCCLEIWCELLSPSILDKEPAGRWCAAPALFLLLRINNIDNRVAGNEFDSKSDFFTSGYIVQMPRPTKENFSWYKSSSQRKWNQSYVHEH